MLFSLENTVFTVFSCIIQNSVLSLCYYLLPFFINVETQGISINLNKILCKGGLSALKECGEKREGEDGLARDWYMVGRGGVAGKGGNIAKLNIQENKHNYRIFI